MRGGARVRSGPAPDPTALRRDRPTDAGWTHLPAAGRVGPAPVWPLTRPTRRELDIWARLWAMPQAAAWEASRSYDAVACYARALRIAESAKARSNDRTLVKQYQDSLGLTDYGLRANRWQIEGNEPAATLVRTDDPDRISAKARFSVIAGDAIN